MESITKPGSKQKKPESRDKLTKQIEKHFLGYELQYRVMNEHYSISIRVPWPWGSFQVSSKLYICGEYESEYELVACSSFYSLTMEERLTKLAPLSGQRESLSLSGIPSSLIATGRFS